MGISLLEIFDLVGTIAFAISGSVIAIRKNMDVFGVNVLAITTACGGGIIRDLIIGNTPPNMFRNPFYAAIAAVVANIVFILAYCHQKMPKDVGYVYDRMLFWFDTLGLAAFTVDGFMVGVNAGYHSNEFLLVFLGFMTGVGGGALRDIMADQMPDIFLKHIYASASIAGGLFMVLLYFGFESQKTAMIGGFLLIILLRYLAAKYHWNLPKVSKNEESL